MNLPGLSDFERRILEKECGAGRRAVRGHTTQAPQTASTAAEGSSPTTPPTPPPEPPRRVGGASNPPELPNDFKMNVMFSAWFDKNIYSCTIAYSRFGAGQGNRLYIAKTTSGYTDTKTYDFDNDLMIVTSGKARTCKTIKGIPESEKVDPFFPVAFKSSDGKKFFDEPNSLIRFLGDKRSMTESPNTPNEWKTEVTVTIDNQVHHCGLVSIWSENGTVTPLCDRKNENHGACPPIPMDSGIDCEGKQINYLFSDYTEYLDYSIFEASVNDRI
ncbi:hypothetical protein HPB47_012758 [Ixodes persulcatus]|uniref:Uncharacterized protein n=1 Tax=Ixodes persulcatus TaxID=34615 RepID=A0AC60NSN7_IXOPE|nr:hypothetical protein HPB47_012758 [Ixodes persulcatus]